MKRREFLHHVLGLTPIISLGGCSTLKQICAHCFPSLEEVTDHGEVHAHGPVQQVPENRLQDLRARSEYFESDFPDDRWVRGAKFEQLVRLVKKLSRIESYVGHGNFNIVGFDEAVRFADTIPGLGGFDQDEKRWLEELFYFDARNYGFQGEKVFPELDHSFRPREVIKVPYTGHYLLDGSSYATYQRLVSDVGEGLILTSGVRGMAKQFHLFLKKAVETGGNLSRASRSLAPPGYSFHGRGDFDVGQIGAGLMNFTEEFAKTREFERLIELGYVDIRYEQSNLLGVRFEPWHIKVES